MPGAHELPMIRIGHLHTPATATEYGMKGMGEGGAVAPPAAIANAVRDALAGLGAEVNETPVTAQRVLAAIRTGAGAGRPAQPSLLISRTHRRSAGDARHEVRPDL